MKNIFMIILMKLTFDVKIKNIPKKMRMSLIKMISSLGLIQEIVFDNMT